MTSYIFWWITTILLGTIIWRLVKLNVPKKDYWTIIVLLAFLLASANLHGKYNYIEEQQLPKSYVDTQKE